jgi:hypothetical protein
MSTAHPIREWTVLAAVTLLAGCDRVLPEAPAPPTPDRITIQPAGPTTLTSLGDTLRLSATVRDGEGNILADAPVSWASARPSVASVTEAGLTEAISDGSSSIRATSGDAAGDLLLNVRQTAASLTITPTLPDTVFFRDTIRLTAVASDARGHPIANPYVAWSMSPPPAGQSYYAMLFVTPGDGAGSFGSDIAASGPSVLVSPVDDGVAQIVARAGTGSVALTVATRRRIASIAIKPNPIEPLDVGSVAEPFLISEDSHGSPGYVNPRTATLTSSDPAVAEVVLGINEADAPQFYVVAHAPGTVVLTASLTTVDGSFSATAPVTVKPAQ